MLQAQALSVEVGGRLVVAAAGFTVMPRDKVGIVGRNGAGKTSLFKVLGGAAEPAAGTVVRKGGFGYLPQDPRIEQALEARTAVTHVLSGRGIDEELVRIEKLRAAMEENPTDRNVARFSRAQEQFQVNGGYSAESEARSLAAGLGLDETRMELPIGVLSGGERRRVELARILFAGSDVLCLDEPTNHLDVDAKLWLMGFLRQYRGALLVISHDLDLLDEAITRVLHLDRPTETAVGTIVEYKGTYSQYVAARAEDERRQAKLAAQQGKEIARMQRVVDRFGAKATKAAMAHNMEKRIARLEAERVDAPKSAKTLRVRFPAPPPAGKTSLLRILAGETAADRGTVTWGHNVTPGYYAQEHDNLRVTESLLDNIRREVPPGVVLTETQLRGLLGMFGLSGDKVFQEAGTLSGGEKTKLALAMLMVGRNNLLLLDEPTNNLDPGSRQSVADSLAAWPGALILVSHDTEFVEQLSPTKVLLLPDGELDYFNPGWLDLVALA